ncbi:MAG: MmgE/PrpD family protein [Paracoccaceae bacterium]|nr:MmgE/PrpD family protein [Paracoccaceae bacterium]
MQTFPSIPDASVSNALDFALGLDPSEVPKSAIEAAALACLDTLGVCAAATPMEAGRLARDAAVMLYNTPDLAHRARLLFDGRSASLPGAAFAAATQIDNLDAHDGYNPTKGHIGVAAVPALAALAEARPDLSGAEALATLVVGYEIAGRAGIALHATVEDYHTSGAWNALGVAAMAARLRGASREVLRHAMGIAEYHGPRSQMMREIANPTMLHDGSGQGALVGLSALVMAEMGFQGAPAVTVEAPEAALHWADLGTFWQVEHQYVKPYPVCRWAHPAIDAVREMALAHDLRPAAIARIEVRSFHNAARLFPGMPATTSEAQYSLPFSVATMLVRGAVGVEHITGAGLADAEVAALVDRIAMIEDPRHERRYPAGRWADVAVHLTDGTVLASGDTEARGGPERPFSKADVVAKFEAFAEPALGRSRTVAIRDAVLGLAEPSRPFADLARHLYDAP